MSRNGSYVLYMQIKFTENGQGCRTFENFLKSAKTRYKNVDWALPDNTLQISNVMFFMPIKA